MARIVNGTVVQQTWYQSVIDTFWSILNSIAFFFQTLVTPDATEAYKRHAQKKGWGANSVSGGGRPGGGGGGGGGRPRFGGMANVRSKDHNAACGAGG